MSPVGVVRGWKPHFILWLPLESFLPAGNLTDSRGHLSGYFIRQKPASGWLHCRGGGKHCWGNGRLKQLMTPFRLRAEWCNGFPGQPYPMGRVTKWWMKVVHMVLSVMGAIDGREAFVSIRPVSLYIFPIQVSIRAFFFKICFYHLQVTITCLKTLPLRSHRT